MDGQMEMTSRQTGEKKGAYCRGACPSAQHSGGERTRRKFGLSSRQSSIYRVSTHLKKLHSRHSSLSFPPLAVRSCLQHSAAVGHS